jgi:methylenetetrahydrofolate reductase (NADPH)
MAWLSFGGSGESPLSTDQRAALAAVVAVAKYELIPLKNIHDQAAALPAGARVTITASPTHTIEATIAASEVVARRGHDVTPHLSARMIRDRGHLSELLARLRAAHLRKIFVVGGDVKDTGEFPDGIALLRAIQEAGESFDEIGVPSYPEGHPSIPDAVLVKALLEKQRYSQYLTTQMSFNPGAVADWIFRVRSAGVTLPIYLGVPGALELTKLMTIAARIGVADSAKFLAKHLGLLGHIANPGSFGADAFLRSLADTVAHPVANVAGLHIFTMNQARSTAAWHQRLIAELARPLEA